MTKRPFYLWMKDMGKNFIGRAIFFGFSILITLISPDFWSSSRSYFFLVVFVLMVFWEEIKITFNKIFNQMDK